MTKADSKTTFEDQMNRIRRITGKLTQVELADFFGIKQSAVSDANRRKIIPAEWLTVLAEKLGIAPEWVLTGNEPSSERCESEDAPCNGKKEK